MQDETVPSTEPTKLSQESGAVMTRDTFSEKELLAIFRPKEICGQVL